MVKGDIARRLGPGLEADALTGGFDAIVHAEAKTLPAPTRLVVGHIRGIHGVQASETFVTTEI